MTVGKAPRVLVLHGHFQNAKIIASRMSALRKHIGAGVDFVFVEAPNILEAVDVPGAKVEAYASDGQVMRGWWNPDLIPNKAVGLEDSLATIRDVLKNDQFDGVFGFSQGAALAGLVAALLERPHVYPDFLVDGKAPHPPLKFCVSISGFPPPDPISELAFTPSYETPTLHIIGKNDVIVVEERSWKLVELNSSKFKRVEVHEGGHYIPTKTSWKKFMGDWMRDPLTEWPAPGSIPASAPPSGAATPFSTYRS